MSSTQAKGPAQPLVQLLDNIELQSYYLATTNKMVLIAGGSSRWEAREGIT